MHELHLLLCDRNFKLFEDLPESGESDGLRIVVFFDLESFPERAETDPEFFSEFRLNASVDLAVGEYDILSDEFLENSYDAHLSHGGGLGEGNSFVSGEVLF